jgi:flagellar biosynthesis GTPase FlhF
MLTEQSIIDQISVDPVGNISVRRADQVVKDGVVLSSVLHRHVLAPGADLSNEDPAVQAIAAAKWTPESMKAVTAAIVTQAKAETVERTAALDEAEAAKVAAEKAKSEHEAAQAQAEAAKAAAEAKTAEAKTAEAESVAALAAAEAARIAAIPAPVAEPTDPTVTDLQIRLAMNDAGLRDAVEAAVKAGDQTTRDWYERATHFKRHDPLVLALADALKVTDEQLDGLWALAAIK